MASGDALTAAVERAGEVMGDARSDLERLVRIPSVGIDPDHERDVEASADATAEMLSRCGLENVRLASIDQSAPRRTLPSASATGGAEKSPSTDCADGSAMARP